MKLNTALIWSIGYSSMSVRVGAVLKCGSPLTHDCLGKTDKRYDPNYSNALKDQNDVWKNMEGFWMMEERWYNNEGLPIKTTAESPILVGMAAEMAKGKHSTFPLWRFINVTVQGSRQYRHMYSIMESLEPTIPSIAQVFDNQATSTYEKDGTARVMSVQMFPTPLELQNELVKSFGNANPTPFGERGTFKSSDQGDMFVPIGDDGRSLFFNSEIQEGEASAGGNVDHYGFFSCTDAPCNHIVASGDDMNATARSTHALRDLKRVSEEQFIAAINDAYAKYNVASTLRFKAPMEGVCLTGKCPSEEDWCAMDPECSVSPYKEPPAAVKGGAIAGIALACAAVVFSAMYGVFIYKLNQQAKRNKIMFCRAVGNNIRLRGNLTPEALQQEFKKIDEAHESDGKISKEELREFLLSGKIGEVNEKDFDALWNVMDADGSGDVDFLEFCSYLGHCHDVYEETSHATKEERKKLIRVMSERIQIQASDDEEQVPRFKDWRYCARA